MKDPEQLVKRFKMLGFNDILKDLDLKRTEYLDALRTTVKGKYTIFHERKASSLSINNYNPSLLLLNKANMDLTWISGLYTLNREIFVFTFFFLDAFATISYILGYLTKVWQHNLIYDIKFEIYLFQDETSMSEGLRAIDKAASQNKSVKEKLRKFESVFDRYTLKLILRNPQIFLLFRNRECSLQEAAYRIEGLDMVKGSRKTKTIIARSPLYRDQLLKPVINSDENDSEDIFVPGLYDHYIVRPKILEKICLCDYASNFEFSSYQKSKNVEIEDDNNDDANKEICDDSGGDDILDNIPAGTQFKLIDGSGFITKRRFRCILMYRRNDKDVLENATATLLLFKSFRDENAEIHNADLHKVMEDNKVEIKKNQEKYEQNASLFENIEELEQKFKDDNGDPILEENEEETETELLDEVKDFEEKYGNYDNGQRKEEESDKISYEELKNQVRSLNSGQRALFDDMLERYSLPLGTLEPLLLHIQGAAGTGKSFLLRTVINGMKYVMEQKRTSISPDQPTVVVGAPTNNAAFNIGGKTIHSLLGFGFMDEENTYSQINGKEAKDLPFKFENTRLMVLDEISMIGTNLFSKISLRLQDILNLLPKWKFNSFGGLDLLLLGDFYQLPPVLDRYIFLNSTLRGRCEALSKNHYADNVCCYTLTEKMRSQDDLKFGSLCDAIANETLTKEHHRMLKSRCDIPCPYEENHDNFKNGNLMVLCLENSTIKEINEDYLNRLNQESKIYTFKATDRFAHLSEPVGEIDINYTNCGNLASTLQLKLDCPVMLTKNISKPDGLLNGKKGYIHEIDESKGICWIKFQENIGNIARMKEKSRPKKFCQDAVPIYLWKNTVSFHLNGQKKRGPIVHRRNQFPLVLGKG